MKMVTLISKLVAVVIVGLTLGCGSQNSPSDPNGGGGTKPSPSTVNGDVDDLTCRTSKVEQALRICQPQLTVSQTESYKHSVSVWEDQPDHFGEYLLERSEFMKKYGITFFELSCLRDNMCEESQNALND